MKRRAQNEIPPLDLIEQAFHDLCTELHAQGTISVVNYPQHDEKMEMSDESTESR